MHTAELYAIFLKNPVVTTDSRNCPSGSIFFALRGEKFDGNDYIEQALSNGAAFAVGDREDLPQDNRIIRVDNALKSLQDLANYHRKKLNPKVIAITGTNGKTTTKELIAVALSTTYTVLYTHGNLNNHIGVPLTLLRLKPEHRFAIIEMGANHIGEIRDLCRIADPDFGLITNVGKAHLEGFGSFEGVVRAKTELYDYIREKGGSVFVNIDNPILKERSENTNRIFYGTSPEAFVRGRIVDSGDGLELEYEETCSFEPSLSQKSVIPSLTRNPLEMHADNQGIAGQARNDKAWTLIKTQLVGNYNFENVLAAICISKYFEVETEHSQFIKAIANYSPTNNRSQNLKTERNHLIIDAYNANPSSMQVALDNFFSLKVSPKMVILGEMKELGEYSEEEHQKLFDRLSENSIDMVILCGENFRNISSKPPELLVFLHTQDLLDYLKDGNISGFHILIKGSRTNQLERTIEFL